MKHKRKCRVDTDQVNHKETETAMTFLVHN